MSSLKSSLSLSLAGEYLGLKEWPGATHNPDIMAMFEATGHKWVTTDETPWCAAFVGSVLSEAGMPNSGKLNARSYLDWGTAVERKDAQPGDVVVLWRKNPTSWEGHVGFLVRFEGDKVIMRGGNQTSPGAVTDSPYLASRILKGGIRRGVFGKIDDNRPLLRVGSKGAFVTDLQTQLANLRYFSGMKDGDFGPLTDAAVRAFQKDAKIEVDGVVGNLTWTALEKGTPKPDRAVSAAALRAAGSETIATADKVKLATAAGAALASLDALTTTVNQVKKITDQVDSTTSTLTGTIDKFGGLLTANWEAILLIVVCAVGWFGAQKIIAARLHAARSGADLSK